MAKLADKKQGKAAAKKLPVLQIAIAAAVVAVIAVLIIVFWQPLIGLLENPDRIKAFVSDAGIFGPLVFISIQFLQILIAPIPGQVIGFVSGALFGTWLGTLYSIIGSFLGMLVVISLARKLGRPFVERFVDDKVLRKFDYLINNNGPIVFFFIMLLPIFPDDLICYLVGLSKIPVRTLVIVGTLGRIPTTIGSALIGAGVTDVNVQLVVAVALIATAIIAVGYWQRARLETWIKQLSLRTGKRGE